MDPTANGAAQVMAASQGSQILTGISPVSSYSEVDAIAKGQGLAPTDENGKKYYELEHSDDGQGHSGTWRVYEDNAKQFIVNTGQPVVASVPPVETIAVVPEPVVTEQAVEPEPATTTVNHAGAIHSNTGFSGHASELHSAANLEIASEPSVAAVPTIQPSQAAI